MLNGKFHNRAQSNNQSVTSSNKKSTPSPLPIRKEREKSPSIDKNLCYLITNRKNTSDENNKLNLTERNLNRQTKTDLNSNQKFNSRVNEKSLSKDKKTPIPKVNLLQTYYAMKNSSNSNLPKNSLHEKNRFSISKEKKEKINTSTSKEKRNINKIDYNTLKINNRKIGSNNLYNSNKNEKSFDKSVEKFNNSNTTFFDNKKKSLNNLKSLNSTSKSKSKSPSSRIQSKSPKRDNSNKPIILNSPFVDKKSPSPLKINKPNQKNISLLKKYEELKSREKSPRLSLNGESKKLSNKVNVTTKNIGENYFNIKSNKTEDHSFTDFKKQSENKVSFTKTGSERQTKSNSMSLNNSNVSNSENIFGLNNSNISKGINSKKDSKERIRNSRDPDKKTPLTFIDMNTSPFVTKKNFTRTNQNSDKKNSTVSKLLSSEKKEEVSSSSKTSLLKLFMENNGRLNIINSPDSTNSKSTINSNLPSKSNSNSNSTNSIPIHKTIKKIHHTSKIGYDIDRTKKHNQDSYFVGNNFTNDLNSVFMTVCDGHGIFGHEVSRFLKKTLPLILSNELKHRIKLGDRDTNKIKQIIEKVFISVNYLLMNDNTIDTNFSGSTCISVLFSPEKLICANVGDSRAVLGRLVNSRWTSIDLSRDHKPCEKDEASRIKRKGGRIQPYKDENGEFYGPERIWLLEEEIPGLAMSRSFGDKVAALVGVICEPEIMEWKFTSEDKFLIVASDGLWEFLESDECIKIVKDFYLKDDIEGALEMLIKESSDRWLTEEECVDDTTIIIVFFD